MAATAEESCPFRIRRQGMSLVDSVRATPPGGGGGLGVSFRTGAGSVHKAEPRDENRQLVVKYTARRDTLHPLLKRSPWTPSPGLAHPAKEGRILNKRAASTQLLALGLANTCKLPHVGFGQMARKHDADRLWGPVLLTSLGCQSTGAWGREGTSSTRAPPNTPPPILLSSSCALSLLSVLEGWGRKEKPLLKVLSRRYDK